MRLTGLIFAAALVSRAQDLPAGTAPAGSAPAGPPVLTNTGKPMTVAFQCTADDIHFAGLDCPEDDPCPVYLELSTVESSQIRIFAGGNIHTKSATLYSVLLGSDDNGRTWREVFDRVRGAALERIQWAGADNAWASGELVYPLPQDPFLLKTTDGGKTWVQHPIFNEQRLGTIQQFWFEDPKNGAMTIDHGPGSEGDRYELYESQDGGDTWNIKESSVKPLRLRRAPVAPPASEWRVRADGPSKSFHIEHREGQRWISVGAFAVNLGVCKAE
jgi:hypothetical protein